MYSIMHGCVKPIGQHTDCQGASAQIHNIEDPSKATTQAQSGQGSFRGAGESYPLEHFLPSSVYIPY